MLVKMNKKDARGMAAEKRDADLVQGWCSEVRLAPPVDGYSIIAAIARMTRKDQT